jgi:hypothetical protein
MKARTTLEKIREVAAGEARRANGLVGLWVNWNAYRDHPAAFATELAALGGRSAREEVAGLLNDHWGGHGIAAVVHRGGQVRRDLASDRALWLRDELSSRTSEPSLAAFYSSLEAKGPTHGHAVVILADQSFAYDGQSLLDWHHNGQILRTSIVDADDVLPSGLTSLLEYDADMQQWVAQLEYNLVTRWNLRETEDPSAMKLMLYQLVDLIVSNHEPGRLRRFAGIPDKGAKNAPLTKEEQDFLRARIHRDLTTRADVIREKRLADRNEGVLNWFLPRDGAVSLKVADLLIRCFGQPTCENLNPDSWAVALIHTADLQERQQIKNSPYLKVAVVTLISLYCMMRFGNVFAHRGEYEFDLPQYVLEGVLKGELRNMQRVAAAWAP